MKTRTAIPVIIAAHEFGGTLGERGRNGIACHDDDFAMQHVDVYYVDAGSVRHVVLATGVVADVTWPTLPASVVNV